MRDRAFELIVNEHRQMLFVYLFSLVRDRALAEDLTQESFLAAYENLSTGTRVRSVPAWLRGIARRMAAGAFKEKSRLLLLPEAAAAEDVISPFDDLRLGDLWEDRIRALKACRDRLPAHQRRAVELHYDRGLDAKSIAEHTGWVRSTVYQLLWGARTFLRECIGRQVEA